MNSGFIIYIDVNLSNTLRKHITSKNYIPWGTNEYL
jgi:hypothetical protein